MCGQGIDRREKVQNLKQKIYADYQSYIGNLARESTFFLQSF